MTLKCWSREKNERHQQGDLQVLFANLTLASPAMSAGTAKMSLDASDVQTDEDFYEDLVRPSLWLGFFLAKRRCQLCCIEMKGQINTQGRANKKKMVSEANTKTIFVTAT